MKKWIWGAFIIAFVCVYFSGHYFLYSFLLPAAVVGVFVIPMVLKEILLGVRESEIIQNGREAKGEVREIKLRSGGNESYPGVSIKAKIYYPDGSIDFVLIEDTIAVTHMPRFQPGMEINVKYDMKNKTRVVLNMPTR